MVVQCRKSGRTRHEEASTAANRLHDQQFVAVTYMSVGMPRARHDDAIVLDRDPFATEIQKFEQLGQSKAVFQMAAFVVDADLHGNWYPWHKVGEDRKSTRLNSIN